MIRTPLIELKNIGEAYKCRVYAKLEYTLPTGTHKDRATVLLVADAIEKQYSDIGIASTGNAAISLSHYARNHGLQSYIFCEKEIPPEKAALIAVNGANIFRYSSYLESYIASNEYFSMKHIYNCNPGINCLTREAHRAIAKEIAEVITPDVIVCPVNNASLLLGIVKGFEEISQNPMFIGTTAYETYVNHSIKGTHLLERVHYENACSAHSISLVNVDDDGTKKNMDELSVRGSLKVESASATTLSPIRNPSFEGKTICLILTGKDRKVEEIIK